MYRHLTKEGIKMTNEHMRRYATSQRGGNADGNLSEIPLQVSQKNYNKKY